MSGLGKGSLEDFPPSHREHPGRDVLQAMPPLQFHFPPWAPPHVRYCPVRSLYVAGISSRGPSFGQATHTHKLHTYAGTRVLIWRWAGVALYNRVFAQSIITHHHGVGGVFLPWAKGLGP